MPGLLEILTTISEHWKKSRSSSRNGCTWTLWPLLNHGINLTSEDRRSHLIQRAIDGI